MCVCLLVVILPQNCFECVCAPLSMSVPLPFSSRLSLNVNLCLCLVLCLCLSDYNGVFLHVIAFVYVGEDVHQFASMTEGVAKE